MAASSPALLDVLGTVRRWRRPILVTTLAAAVISTVVALRLPNLYPATATFYATNLETTDPDRLSDGAKLSLSGRPEDQDRAVNIGGSQPLGDRIISKYHLASHYKLDSAVTPEALQQVREMYYERLDIQVTERDAVEVTFIDADRDLAATIANDIVEMIDSVSQQLTRPNRQRVITLYKDKFEYFETAYQRVRDSLAITRRYYGIYGMDREDRYLTRAMTEKETALREARARQAALRTSGQSSAGLSAEIAGLEAALAGLYHQSPTSNTLTRDAFLKGRPLIERLQSEVNDLLGRVIAAKGAYESARLTLGGRVSSVYIVQPAYPIAKKVKPIRWLIVASSTLGAFLLITLGALLLELYQQQLLGPKDDENDEPDSTGEPVTRAAWQRVSR